MENNIINPSVFYWMSVISTLHVVFWAIGVTFLMTGIFMLPDNGVLNKTSILWIVFSILFLLIGVFLPSKEVMYQILASKYVTKDVANKGLEYINNIVNQLLNYK